MAAGITRQWDGTVLLVTDPSDGPDMQGGSYDRRIDRPVNETVAEMRKALEKCSAKVTVISDLGELTDRLGRHQHSLVFPYWFGQQSRSRHGLVPAMCEANHTMYVGADAFTKIACNDKELSKTICRQAGLDTPASGLIRAVGDLRFLRHLRLPLMVKPNYEGTSLGIGARNKCGSWPEAEAVAEELLRELGQPVVVEEFVSGREFSTCLMRSATGIEALTGSWTMDGRADYLDEIVFSAELKVGGRADMAFSDENVVLPGEVIEKMRDCFRNLGKVDLLRIDGRCHRDGCTVIELTPDIYLGADGEFSTLFGRGRGGYAGFVSAVVRNCVEGYGAGFPV